MTLEVGAVLLLVRMTVHLFVTVLDNRALSLASNHAKKDAVPLVVIFILSPQDYTAHDRSPRRIDFMLRNLSKIQANFSHDYHRFLLLCSLTSLELSQ